MGFVTHLSAGNHFKRHGLDIIMELERRERQQLLPWHWGQTVTGRYSSRTPQLIDYRTIYKTSGMGYSIPPSLMNLDFSKAEAMVLDAGDGMHRLAAAARLATAGFESFADARRSLDEWAAGFGVHRTPTTYQPTLTQGPGKAVEAEGERHYDRKRILKDRKRKKLAKKSRRK
jgi:hypothetical protein